MYVLQVGIGKYQYTPTWAQLRGAVNDVVETRKLLESERFGIPSSHIVTLTDAQGTKQQIFDKFRAHLIANAKSHYEKTKTKDAVVLFQFSGHGSQTPDADGDEKDDGKDETLVTVDSQDAAGKNFDITDDEIFALTAELRRWTDNIVYIFDSCHSGSGTRNAEDVRRLPERKSVPVAVAGVGTATRSGISKADDGDSNVLPPGDDYIVITAARASELASEKECFEECGQTSDPVVYGNLTYYLVDELKNARSDTSYRELMENVTRRVTAAKSTQTPQIEGDKARMVFGSLAKREDPFVQVAEVGARTAQAKKSVKIRAGGMQGVAARTVVAFYDRSVSRFDEAEPIATGLVVAVSPSESTVEVTNPKRDIKVEDKASIVTADLGSLKLDLLLDADAAKLTAAQKRILDGARQMLAADSDPTTRNVNVVSPQLAAAGRWDIAILRDKFSAVSPKMGGEVTCSVAGRSGQDPQPKTAGDAEVFYIAGKDYVPLYGFCLDATNSSETAAAERIRDVALHLAHIRSVKSITNRRSALRGMVKVKPIRLTGEFGCDEKTSRFTYGTATPLTPDPKTGYHPLSIGDVVWLEVTNNSPRDLYLTLINLATDGSIELSSPRKIDGEQDGIMIPRNGGKRILMSDQCREVGGQMETGAFLLTGPNGLETFKLIASVKPTRHDDFIYLERPALATRNNRASLVSLDDWTTVETILQISATGK
jgi:hypothetical protein